MSRCNPRIIPRAWSADASPWPSDIAPPYRLAYITEHLAQPITLRDLAALAHLAPYHFLRAFRQATGVTPHQDIMARRMARAQALLEDPSIRIPEVASRVGFQTASHFAMCFRRRAGVTPTAYRTAYGRRPLGRATAHSDVPRTVPRVAIVASLGLTGGCAGGAIRLAHTK